MSDTENENTENVEETPPVDEAAAETPVAEETSPEAPTVNEAQPEASAGEEASAAPTAEETSPEAPTAESAPESPREGAEEGGTGESAPPPAAGKKKRKRLPRAQRRQRTKTRRERPAERPQITRLPKPESERGQRQERRGVVVSSAMDKTIVVKVDTVKAHTKYKKVVRRSVKFHAHDEENQAKVGDLVLIVETRPLSRTKNWRLAEIVEAAR